MDFTEKIKGFLFEPSKTFDAIKGENLNEAIKYYAVFVAVLSVISAVFIRSQDTRFGSMMGAGAGAGGAIISFILFLIFGAIITFVLFLIMAFISGAILHIVVGGRKGIAETIKAMMYAGTPVLLVLVLSPAFLSTISWYSTPVLWIGWIMIGTFIAGPWSLILEILGIRQLQELTTQGAIMAVLISNIIIVILTVVLAAIIR